MQARKFRCCGLVEAETPKALLTAFVHFARQLHDSLMSLAQILWPPGARRYPNQGIEYFGVQAGDFQRLHGNKAIPFFCKVVPGGMLGVRAMPDAGDK